MDYNQRYSDGLGPLKEEVVEAKEIFRDVQERILELVAENQRLTRQLQAAVSAHIRDLTLRQDDSASEWRTSELERQLQLIRGEKDSVVNLWQEAQKEIDRLERELEDAKCQPEVKVLRGLVDKLQREHRNVLATLVAKSSGEAEETNQWRNRFRASELQSQNLSKMLESSKQRLAKKQEELECSSRQEHLCREKEDELQATIAQLHLRLETANLETAEMEDSTVSLQNEMTLLHNKLLSLKAERLEAIQRAKENVQLAEEALQERDAAVVREQQALREVNRLQAALSRLVEEAGIKTGHEVENVKSSCNGAIEELLDEIKSLELTSNHSRSQLEKQCRDKQMLIAKLARTVEECELRVASAAALRKADGVEQERVNWERENALALLESSRTETTEAESRLRLQAEEHQRSQEVANSRVHDLTSRVEFLTEQKLEQAVKVEELQRQLADDRESYERRIREIQKEVSGCREDWELQKESLKAKLLVQEELQATAASSLHQNKTGQMQALNSRQLVVLSTENGKLRAKVDRLEAKLRDRQWTGGATNNHTLTSIWRDA